MDLQTWTTENPAPSVRLAGSNRIHTARLIGGRVLIPACGTSVGTSAVRIPCTDTVTCPACARAN